MKESIMKAQVLTEFWGHNFLTYCRNSNMIARRGLPLQTYLTPFGIFSSLPQSFFRFNFAFEIAVFRFNFYCFPSPFTPFFVLTVCSKYCYPSLFV